MCCNQSGWYHRNQSKDIRLQYDCPLFDHRALLNRAVLHFILAKPKIDGKVNDVTVQITEPAELRTKFSAIPKPTVTW